MRFSHLITCLIVLVSIQHSIAQLPTKLQKAKNKVNTSITNGYFYKARKSNQAYISELEKTSFKSELAFALVNEVKISSFLGDSIAKWENTITKGSLIIQNEESTKDLVFFYATVADIYNIYGDYNKAKSYLDKASAVAISNPSANDWYPIILAQTNFNIFQGYFNNALKDLDTFTGKYKQSLATTTIEIKNGKEVFTNIRTKDIHSQNRKYAQLLHLKTKALLSSGNFSDATLSLQIAKIWIEENINKRDISYIDNKILEGELALAQEDYKKASKIFNETYSKNIHKTNHGVSYKPTSPQYLNFIGMTATANWLNESNSDAKQIYNHIEPKVKRYYDKETPQYTWINALKGQKNYYRGNFKKAISLFEDVMDDSTSLPKGHPYRLEIANFLLRCYLAQKDFVRPLELMKEIDELNNSLNILESPTYYRYKLEEAVYITKYSNDIEKADDAFSKGLQIIKEAGLSQQNPKYIDFLNDKALYLVEKNEISNAIALIKRTTANVIKAYGIIHFRYGNQLERLSNIYLITGNFSLAYKNALESTQILNEYSNRKLNRAQALRTYANGCIVRGQYKDAEKALHQAQNLSNESDITLDIDEFSTLYINNGEYARVEAILLESIETKTAFFGRGNKRTLPPLQQLTELYLILGDYTKADEYNDKAIDLSEVIYGEDSFQYSSCLKQKAHIKSAIGDYPVAIDDYKIVLAIEEKNFGKSNIIPAETSMLLALNRYYNGEQNIEIENTLNEAVQTIQQNFEQKDNPIIAKSLTLLSIYQIEIGKLDIAEKNLIRANTIWEKGTNLDKGNKHTAKILTLRATIHAYQKDYTQSLHLYNEAAAMYKKIFSNSHPDYVHTYSKLGQMYYIAGDEKKALKITEESALLNMKLVKNFFPALSERGKAQFWATHQSDFEFYNTLAFRYHEKKPKLVANVYNFLLSTKYLLLNSSIKVRQSILTSGNVELINKYRLYQSKREDLFKTMTSSKDVISTNTNNRKSLEKEIETLEEELSKQSALFNASTEEKSLTWQDVQAQLKPNEYAIEMIRYRYFDKSFSDSIVYAALIISPETKKAPEVVILPNGKILETNSLKYYRNAVKFKFKDTKSYGNYWKAISEKVKPQSTIYFSGEGVYTQINMETFLTPTDKYLIEEYDLVLLTNTKDLLTAKKEVKNVNLPVFFANPSYYLANSENKDHKNLNNKQTVKQLAGAEHEIESIENVLNHEKVEYIAYIYEDATEQAIKKLDSPQFLHLATHGYFIENADYSHADIDENRAIENSLLKSGLLLANGGDLIDAERFYNYNKNDGILTSLEAMNLNLDNTDFVVLSACETGLGEIKNGEGVYGLQRALQLAGVKTIIMSLFKVDDEVTDKLMSLFYKKFYILKDKRKAFNEAKKALMKEYNSPYYWGAFIMIE